MGEPHHLQGLLESLRRIFRHDSAVFGYGQKFLLPLRICTFGSLTLRFIGHAMSVGDQTVALDDAGLPEIDFLLILFAGSGSLSYVFAAFLHISLQSYGQEFFVITGCFAGYAVGQSDSDDVVRHTFPDMRRNSIFGHVLHGLPFPVRQSLQNDFFVLRRNIVRILGTRGKLVNVADIPGTGLEFGMQVGASVFVGRGADDQLVLHDQCRHPLCDIADDFRTEFRNSGSCEFFISFCRQNKTL